MIMARKKKAKKTLEEKIDQLELEEMDEGQIERVVSSLSTEGLSLRRIRKGVRYKLFRIQTEVMGGTAANVEDDFKAKFESHPNFEGWRFFGVLWDVALDDPYECVHRDKSLEEEWNEVIANKFPTIEPGGKVSYPDIKVRKRVEQAAAEEK